MRSGSPPMIGQADQLACEFHRPILLHVAELGSVAARHGGLNRVVDAGGPVTQNARGNLTSEVGRSFSCSSENLLTGLTALGRSWTATCDPMLRLQHTTASGATSRTYAYDVG